MQTNPLGAGKGRRWRPYRADSLSMDTPNRPLRRVAAEPQPRVPVGKLPFADQPADNTENTAEQAATGTDNATQTPTPQATNDASQRDNEPETATDNGHTHGHTEQSEQSQTTGEAAAHGGTVIEDDPEPEVMTPDIAAERAKPTPDTSGDKRVKREVAPRRDLVTFEDDPDHKPLSNRRKRTRLNKGGMFFNERDRQIVLLVAAHGWLSKDQIAALLDTSPEVRKSVRRLATHGLLDDKCMGFQNEVLYTATAFGLRKVGAVGFHTQVTPRLQTIEHTEAITAAHAYLKAASGNNPNVCFLTERELQAAATSGVLTPRVLAAYPWTAAYRDFQKWVPSTVTAKGKPIYKRPDGLILQFKSGQAQPPVPVEIERSIKTRADYYQQAALMFANTAASGHISPSVLYFAPASTGVQEALTKALAAVYDPNSGFNWPAALPRVGFDVQDLDSFYIPYSVTRGWIAASTMDATDSE